METRFRLHYKNKPYRYLGVARHSETLEEVALYECLYENALGTLWVRPRGMFEESVKIEGQEIPRFRQVPLKVDTLTDAKAIPWERLRPMLIEILGEADQPKIEERLQGAKSCLVLIGSFEGRDAGFKIAYQKDATTFHSWLGGVLPAYRALGVFSFLADKLEIHARKQGCARISTSTLNRWTEMLVLNLRRGFQITGTAESVRGLKIRLEKSLH